MKINITIEGYSDTLYDQNEKAVNSEKMEKITIEVDAQPNEVTEVLKNLNIFEKHHNFTRMESIDAPEEFKDREFCNIIKNLLPVNVDDMTIEECEKSCLRILSEIDINYFNQDNLDFIPFVIIYQDIKNKNVGGDINANIIFIKQCKAAIDEYESMHKEKA